MHRLRRLLAAIGVIGALAIGALPPGVARAAEPVCFPTITSQCVDARFADFWARNNTNAISGASGYALTIFGYPVGPARVQSVDGVALLVQPFERVVMQLPLGSSAVADVSLQAVGRGRLAQLGRSPDSDPAGSASGLPASCRYFSETGHRLCDDFKTLWESNGLNLDNERGYTDAERLALFGRPLTEPARETSSDGSGRSYITQWFERARVERRTDLNLMVVSLLGRDVAAASQQMTLPLPTNRNATVSAVNVPAGNSTVAQGGGFPYDEIVAVYVTRADGTIFDPLVRLYTDRAGLTPTYCFVSPPNALPGIWAITFESTRTGLRSYAFFRITNRIDATVAISTCPPPGATTDGSQ